MMQLSWYKFSDIIVLNWIALNLTKVTTKDPSTVPYKMLVPIKMYVVVLVLGQLLFTAIRSSLMFTVYILIACNFLQ